MDDNCGEWVECMGVTSGCHCGEQEAGVASGSGWNLWVWLLGVVVRRYIDFLLLLIPIYSSCICSFLQQHPYFLFIFVNVFRSCLYISGCTYVSLGYTYIYLAVFIHICCTYISLALIIYLWLYI